jgi:hypothetical protein
VKDLVERIEQNRFVGREFLLWLWFESQLFETNLAPSGQASCALWLETRITLAFDREESVLKCGAPGGAPEAREALRQGKLPREARIRMISEDREFAWLFKADTLGLASVALPAELTKKDDDAHEVLYERMRLVEALEATLEALWSDFLALRLSEAWEATCVPVFGQFAHDEEIDEAGYTKAKQRALAKRPKKA